MDLVKRTCLLCGVTSHDVKFGLVRWANSDHPFGAMPRCTDRAGCETRVKANGDKWEVDDAPARYVPDDWKPGPVIPLR